LSVLLALVLAFYGAFQAGTGPSVHQLSPRSEIHASVGAHPGNGCGESSGSVAASYCCAGFTCQLIGVLPQPKLTHLAIRFATDSDMVAGPIAYLPSLTFHPPKSNVQA